MSETPSDQAVPVPVVRDTTAPGKPTVVPSPIDSPRALEVAALEATLPPPERKPEPPPP